ncbi:MAG: NAD-dependent DNA ligase LigA, partial [Deltaproteobacteria bacterium]|nr:NAD-dependent DNA ligase LigA [Deltaproteobacteria bacterium]
MTKKNSAPDDSPTLAIPNDPAGRAKFLRQEIRQHNALYFQEDNPEIPDDAYDRMVRELENLEAAHPELAKGSPTSEVAP